MNDEQEQIEEMAKQMCGAIDNSCIHDCTPACGAREYAERCFKAGYRKQSNTVGEILQKLIYNITANNTNDGYLSESIDYSSTIDDIKELAAQYGVEVKE